jgi:5-methylcytosine-specific restriction protein A
VARLKALPARLQAAPERLQQATGSWRGGATSSAQRGYGYRWQQARAGYLTKHPLCVMCERDGFVTAATIVDHIVPHQGNQQLFWDRNNWQPLCKPHHDGEKAREEAASGQRFTCLPAPG